MILIVYMHTWRPVNGTTKCQTAALSTGVGSTSGWGYIMLIVSVNHLLKEQDVQTDCHGDMMDRSGGGNGVGRKFACGRQMKTVQHYVFLDMSVGRLTINNTGDMFWHNVNVKCGYTKPLGSKKMHNWFVFRVAFIKNSDYAEIITLGIKPRYSYGTHTA